MPSIFVSPDELGHRQIVEVFKPIVETLSGGRILIEPFLGGTLMPVPDYYPALRDGALTICQTATVYQMGFIPVSELAFGLPFTNRTLEELMCFRQDVALEGTGMNDLYRRAAADYGVHMVSIIDAYPYGALQSSVPIRGVDDLDGVKIRTWGMFGDLYESFGAAIVSVSPTETYTALATGVVDALTWGGPWSHRINKFYEVAGYFTEPTLGLSNNEFAMNPKVWNELPDDLKLVVEQATFAANMFYARSDLYGEVWARADLIKNHGVEFNRFSDEDMASMRAVAMTLFEAKAAKDAYSAEAWEMIQKHWRYLGIIE